MGRSRAFVWNFARYYCLARTWYMADPSKMKKSDLVVAGVLSILCWQEFFLCFADTAKGERAVPAQLDQGHVTAFPEQPEKSSFRTPRTTVPGKLSHLRVNRRTGKHNLLATHLPPHLDFGPIPLIRQLRRFRQLLQPQHRLGRLRDGKIELLVKA